ncbi:MAG: YggU family protein [Candidatus Goldbacteria bacterium]|nr:YggU family protein [Candidatus Goldiibacteriota bacterium]HPD19338.1 DUF167 domain-containing protein [Candidatus Goldiibacteriota bacterium]
MFVKNKNGSITLKIKVIPNSPETCIKTFTGDVLRVKINAPPEDNRANKELVRYLAEFFNVKKSNVEIIKGMKSREKAIKIKTDDENKILQKLKEALNEHENM